MVSWVTTNSYKRLPLDVEPHPQGRFVVQQLGHGEYQAEPYDPVRHHGQKRYRSHLDRCRPSSGLTAPGHRPDPTAELKFPRRRRALPPFPPLADLVGAAVLPRGAVMLTQAERRWAEVEVARG